MQLTKYNHACFTVTKDMQTIVVDPGVFSTDFIIPDSVVAVVLTHQHTDHADITKIQAVIERNPAAIIYAHESTANALGITVTNVQSGDVVNAGPFTLAFYGGQHAVIEQSIPPIANLGVMINDHLYYPGDSFTIPSTPVRTLALPIAAPWMKISEAMEFLMHIKPALAFPTHDAILSPEGKEIYDRLLAASATAQNTNYQRLGSPIQLI
jgi:L-ascorbate metabolism protein UlaG (beta-lactamase superfamily)